MSDDGDPWPAEPDDPGEPDHPGREYLDRYGEGDPESELAPSPPSPPSEGDAPEGLFRAFWGLVATVNLGLFAASLGLMLVGFRGQLREGGAVFLLGAGALAYAAVKYRRVRDRDWDDEGEGGAEPPDEARPVDDD